MSSKKNLFIEIGFEDLPSSAQNLLQKEAPAKFSKILEENRIERKDVRFYITPRRMAIIIDNISERQLPVEEKLTGPPYAISVKDGKPTAAGIGFAKKLGVRFEDLKAEETKKGKYLTYVRREEGLHIKELIENIIKEFLLSFNFKITMKWPGYGVQFPRPIRWFTARLDNRFMNISIGALKSIRSTYGHYLFADKKLSIGDTDKYIDNLRQNYVIVDSEERLDLLNKTIDRSVRYIKGKAVKLADLINEISNSVEYPTAIRGRFPEKYLKMPREIIEACLIYHQRYFPVEDIKGKIVNYFIGVRDGISEYLDLIREGYERVLIARLEDAEFFLKNDRKKKLSEYADELKGIAFTRGLGNLYEKTMRISGISGSVCKFLKSDSSIRSNVKKISFLCKADLTTSMVNEFPELEGKVGKIYAKDSGENKKVCESIFQHYLPRTFEDPVPDLKEASIVGISDRMDTLYGNFGSGVEATGSQDPFGMRRTCRGLIRILIGKKWDIDFSKLIGFAEKEYEKQNKEFERKNIDSLAKFIKIQIKNYLEEEFSVDIVRCVLKADDMNPYSSYLRALAISRIKKSKGFDSLITAFKRINNILKQAGEKKLSYYKTVNISILEHQSEKNLNNKFEIAKQITLDALISSDYDKVLKQLAGLRTPIDSFFDDVMVMAPEKQLMKNRLTLLSLIVGLFSPVGDISLLNTSVSDK